MQDEPIGETGDGGVYADRPYERRLVESGRKFMSVDLDRDVADRVDELVKRGKERRGVVFDRLVRIALSSPELQAMT